MKNKKTVIIAIVTALILAGLVAAWLLLKPAAGGGAKEITVNVHHISCEDTSFVINTDEEYLRGALEQVEGLVEGSEEAYGLWITAVDGETADDSLQQWWGYNVNGEMAMYGVEQQPIADGDVIDFILNEGY